VVRKKKKKIDPDPTYRWCDRDEKFVPVSACREKARTRNRCKKCFEPWDKTRYQLPLPLKTNDGRKPPGS